jgi:hypothetical protein
MVALCMLLDDIEEQLPWSGVSLNELFCARSKQREDAYRKTAQSASPS